MGLKLVGPDLVWHLKFVLPLGRICLEVQPELHLYIHYLVGLFEFWKTSYNLEE